MPTIRLPNNWQPRPYQRPLWDYLENGGKRGVAVWHRRAGKDEVALHWSAVAMHMRPATYWHMLPEAKQARKAIWNAVNPHTGRRRIDEAFPPEVRSNTNDQEMFIRFKCGSTWQVVGSDNYDSLVGSPPAGIVFSEWAIAKPSAWAMLRPILLENKGWALFIYTPRGRNHGQSILRTAEEEEGWFGQRLTVDETGLFTPEQLEAEKRELMTLYGQDEGDSLFQQEYYCSFDAALMGSFYGRYINEAEKDERVRKVPYDKAAPVHTAWDLGFTDDTSIWFFQVVRGEIHIIDYYERSGEDVAHYVKVLQDRPYVYGKHFVPHDARPKTFASGGRSILEQAKALGVTMTLVPNVGVQTGIQGVRVILPRCWFDKDKCRDGLEALRQYQREWDEDKRTFKEKPLHNWASHAADAFRYLAVAYREDNPSAFEKPLRWQYEGIPGSQTITGQTPIIELVRQKERARREELE